MCELSNEIKDIIAVFAGVKNEIKEIIKGLPGEALNWKPLENDVNSIYVMISHICGAEVEWIQDTIGGIRVDRDRDQEFIASGKNNTELLDLLDKTQQGTSDVLSKETILSLTRLVQRYPDKPKTTAFISIINCLRHISEHIGQLELTKQLWEISN